MPNSTTERWTGPRPDPEEARERFGADTVLTTDELPERLGRILRSIRTLHYRTGLSESIDQVVREARSFARGRGARTGKGPRTLVDPGGILDEMRLIKQSSEIRAIREAVEITVQGFRSAMSRVKPGVGEWEIEASLDGALRAAGGDGPAFQTIVGSGENACVLHYVSNGRTLAGGELVLIDAGAVRGMYAADISRTIPVDGCFTPIQRDLHDRVNRSREAAIEACRPGRTAADVHRAAITVLSEGLIELDVIEGPVEEAVERERYRKYFPHQTSHWLGLDVHDVGDYVHAGAERELEAGMVLTVEPGLYFSPAGAGALPEELVGIGIRLEDDVLVTGEGPEVLTAELPVAAGDILELLS